MRNKERGNVKKLSGVVIGDKMDKTVVVLVERLVRHLEYHKFVKRRKKFIAHDERNECCVGNKVLIKQSRPLSKRKRWRVSKILEQTI